MKAVTVRGAAVRAVLATTTLVGTGIAAHAQDAPPRASAGALEEITVTARKRAENLQETPVAVSAFAGDALDRTFAVDFKALSGRAPNVSIEQNSTTRDSAISIRGLSHADPESSFDPTVGVVVDGVFVGRSAYSLVSLYDVKQIEILRGPQGTLFGKNTIGGLINLTTNKPSGAYGGDLLVRIANHDAYDVRGALEFPIVAERLAQRFAFQRQVRDGYFTNTRTGRHPNGADQWSFRSTTLFTPSERITATWVNEFNMDDTPGGGSVVNASLPGGGAVVCDVFGQCATPGVRPPRSNTADLTGDNEINIFLSALTVDWDVRGHTLTSVTGYREVRDKVLYDIDSTAISVGGRGLLNVLRDQRHHQVSEEIRATSTWSETLDYVAGLYYFRSNYRITQLADFFFNSFPTTGDQNNESIAAFAQGNYRLTDQWRLTIGGRYTREEKGFKGRLLFGDVIDPRREKTFSSFTPKAGVDYRPNDTQLWYASYTRGTRSGGFSGRAAAAAFVGPFDDEKVDAYELGVKAELFDQRLRANFAAFVNDYKDQQLEINTPAGPVVAQSTQNVGRSRVSGVEAELSARLTTGLTLTWSAGYQDAKYREFCGFIARRPPPYGPGVGAPCAAPLPNGNVPTDNTDLNLRRAPKFTSRVEAVFETTLTSDWMLRFAGDWGYQSKLNIDVQNSAAGARPSINLFNASIAVEDTRRGLRLSLYGQNLGDKDYVQNQSASLPIIDQVEYAAPRVYGVELSAHFGQ